eukprot:TRINITY_DN774014_c0_g1_i1.p1 TRINITY_DN774014_c0_g1~~TRINITY_DN774014_c0_g1_i1.p1  ORF type:complete len:343 (+),score=123.21 TRINITY_DN774014_c0_g1_i1:100-1128(+)
MESYKQQFKSFVDIVKTECQIKMNGILPLEVPNVSQATYGGRCLHFLKMMNPMYMATMNKSAKKQHDEMMASVEKGAEIDESFRAKKDLSHATIHPQSGEPLPYLTRMTAFPIVSVPNVLGMLLAAPTVGNLIFWQWLNQSYNAYFNYANRNLAGSMTTADVAKSYGLAAVSACSIAVGLNGLVKKLSTVFSPAIMGSVGILIPYLAVGGAGSINAFVMRKSELTTGVGLTNSAGEMEGNSQIAAKKCMTEVVLTRMAIPLPILLVPPIVRKAIIAAKMMPKSKIGTVLMDVGVVVACLYGALPLAVGMFPQNGSIKRKDVESQFNPEGCDGEEMLYYNKGI